MNLNEPIPPRLLLPMLAFLGVTMVLYFTEDALANRGMLHSLAGLWRGQWVAIPAGTQTFAVEDIGFTVLTLTVITVLSKYLVKEGKRLKQASADSKGALK